MVGHFELYIVVNIIEDIINHFTSNFSNLLQN